MNPHNYLPKFRPLAAGESTAHPVEGFAQQVQNVCGLFAVEPKSPQHGWIKGSIKTMPVARFDTAIVSLDAMQVTRNRKMIRHDPGEHLFLLVQDKGTCTVHQNGQTNILRAGDMFLVDSSRSSDFVYGGNNSRQISIHLPRQEMLHRFGEICTNGRPIASNDPLFVAMRAVLEKIFFESGATTPQLNDAFLSLLGGYFHGLEHQSSLADKLGNSLLSQALGIIDRRAADPNFSAHALAFELNVTPRTLQRHFGTIGETASKRILNVRLDLAKAQISSHHAAHNTSVSDIAYACGFNDLSYFYKKFRERFDVAPGELRNRMSH